MCITVSQSPNDPILYQLFTWIQSLLPAAGARDACQSEQ